MIRIFSKERDEPQVLVLSFNNFKGEIPSWIWELPKLQILDVSSNGFHGNINNEGIVLGGVNNGSTSKQGVGIIVSYNSSILTNLPSASPLVRVLGIKQVDIVSKGNETAFPWILPDLTSIDRSMNHFSGELPSRLGSLEGLINLDVSQYLFERSLPDSLGSLKALESLDVSANDFSGPILSNLVELNFLAFQKMGENNLSGLIPTGGQFHTFDKLSYTQAIQVHVDFH